MSQSLIAPPMGNLFSGVRIFKPTLMGSQSNSDFQTLIHSLRLQNLRIQTESDVSALLPLIDRTNMAFLIDPTSFQEKRKVSASTGPIEHLVSPAVYLFHWDVLDIINMGSQWAVSVWNSHLADDKPLAFRLRFMSIVADLKKDLRDVKKVNSLFPEILGEFLADSELRIVFMKLNREEAKKRLKKIVSLRVLQQMYSSLEDSEKENLKREAIRGTSFGEVSP